MWRAWTNVAKLHTHPHTHSQALGEKCGTARKVNQVNQHYPIQCRVGRFLSAWLLWCCCFCCCQHDKRLLRFISISVFWLAHCFLASTPRPKSDAEDRLGRRCSWWQVCYEGTPPKQRSLQVRNLNLTQIMLTRKVVRRKKNVKDGNEIMAVADAMKTRGRNAELWAHYGWESSKGNSRGKSWKADTCGDLAENQMPTSKWCCMKFVALLALRSCNWRCFFLAVAPHEHNLDICGK